MSITWWEDEISGHRYAVPEAALNQRTSPITGNDRVPDEKLRTNDISGLSIPAKPGQGAKI